MRINAPQRRALLALGMWRLPAWPWTGRHAVRPQHQLYALIRERYGCKHSCLPADRWKEMVIWLVEWPLTSGGEMTI